MLHAIYPPVNKLDAKLLKYTKRTHFNSPDIKKVTDNWIVWETAVPLFSNKFSRNKKINLPEGSEVISTDSRLSWSFSIFYSKAVKELKTPSILNYKYNGSNDSLKEALGYFKNHPSIALQTLKERVFIQDLLLERLIPMKKLNYQKLWI